MCILWKNNLEPEGGGGGKTYSRKVGGNENSWEQEHRIVRRFPGFARSPFDKGSVKEKTLEWLEVVA
jgi:hypothetical protein